MKTVMIFGTFDILHAGHISLFKQARRHGDRLVAVVARDRNVKRVKGFLPVHHEKERKMLLDHLDLIDETILGDSRDVYKVIAERRPDVIALGYDQKAFVDKLKPKLQEFGLATKIVRLKSYKPASLKSSKIKAHLERTL